MTEKEVFLSACYKVYLYRQKGNLKGLRYDKPFSFLLANENADNFELPTDLSLIESIVKVVTEDQSTPLQQLDFNTQYSTDLEKSLSDHPGVNKSLVVNTEENGIKFRTCYFSFNQNYQPPVMNEENHEENFVSTMKGMYDYTYSQESNESDETFNLIGWNNSYTGRPIAVAEMQEWVDQTVERILAFKPKNVLEIGCGTGLLLYKIASHCESYHGIDLSETVINKLQTEIKKRNLDKKITVECSAADSVKDYGHKKYDTIIINSVTMYLPNADYLSRVLNKAIDALKDGGKLFVGDVRNYDLLPHFHASVNQHKLSEYSQSSALIQFLQKKILIDKQLILSPQYFRNFAKQNGRVSGLRIVPKFGIYINEITKFRYDVTFEINSSEIQVINNKSEWKSIEDCEEKLKQGVKDIAFINFQDQRIINDIETVKTIETRNDYGPILENNNLIAIRELAKKYNYFLEVELQNGENGFFNLIFTKESKKLKTNNIGPVGSILSTNPSIEKDIWNRIADVRQALLEKMPFSQIPSRFICVEDNFKSDKIFSAKLIGIKEGIKIF